MQKKPFVVVSNACALSVIWTRGHIEIIIPAVIGGVTAGPFEQRVWFLGQSVSPDLQVQKNSIMCEDERYVGKARSALSCISLIYYLADFQALILSTLEEESPFFSALSYSTCDIMAGLSAFSMGYNVFRAFFQEGRTFREGNVERWPILSIHEHTQWGAGNSFWVQSHLFCRKFYLFILVFFFFRKTSRSFNGPLDTVWHFQVPSFLCLRCQPLNGVINVPPKSNFHSQLPKETVSCDAFLLDINRSREDQVKEGKQPDPDTHTSAKEAFSRKCENLKL